MTINQVDYNGKRVNITALPTSPGRYGEITFWVERDKTSPLGKTDLPTTVRREELVKDLESGRVEARGLIISDVELACLRLAPPYNKGGVAA